MRTIIKTDTYKVTQAKGWYHMYAKKYYFSKNMRHIGMIPISDYGLSIAKRTAEIASKWYYL